LNPDKFCFWFSFFLGVCFEGTYLVIYQGIVPQVPPGVWIFSSSDFPSRFRWRRLFSTGPRTPPVLPPLCLPDAHSMFFDLSRSRAHECFRALPFFPPSRDHPVSASVCGLPPLSLSPTSPSSTFACQCARCSLFCYS